jgi:DNA polymerase I-like protein with 3'-5' exonuclease and polymerase domains
LIVSFDCETALSIPGLAAPPLACGSFAWFGPDGSIKSEVLDARQTLDKITRLLRDKSVTIVGHNVAYDFAVICAERPELVPLVFQAHADDRIRDTDYRERLIAIAMGEFAEDRAEAYSLETLAKQRLGVTLDKSTHRHGYGKLIGVPLEAWDMGALTYAREDAIATLKVWAHQAAECDDYVTGSPDHAVWHEPHACRKAWALMLMRVWGVRTDREWVEELESRLLAQEREVMRDLVAAGVLQKHPKKDTYTQKRAVLQERVTAAYALMGRNPPMTDKGNIKTDAETCDDAADFDSVLARNRSYNGIVKILDTYVPALKQGMIVPVNAWWNGQLVSDRTSCSGPNWQNPPQAFGVRQCVVPRLGVFCSVDYDTIELKALANFNYDMFGFSSMRDRILQGIDLHTALAARLLGMPYEDAKANKNSSQVKHARKLAKATNFGRPGGMGDQKFVMMSKKQYDLIFSLEEARAYKKVYLDENPEMPRFYAHCAAIVEAGNGFGTVETPGSSMLRGGCTYPAACNQHFQGPVAYGATDALFYLAWECYVDRGTALYGCRPTLFLHDEVILDIPEHKAHEAATRQAEVMIERMQRIFPHVPITASPALMRRWYKDADAQYQDGRLIPWEDHCLRELASGLRACSPAQIRQVA